MVAAPMQAGSREQAVLAWRRGEERLYPVLMVRPELYQRYVRLVRAIADDLRSAASEEALLHAYASGDGAGEEAALESGLAPYSGLDLGLARDAAFCLRHRELLGELQRAEGQGRVERARAAGEEWVTVFEETMPGIGAVTRTVEMHVASGRAIHSFVQPSPDTGRAVFGIELIRLDPATGEWMRDVEAVARQELDDREAWRERIEVLRRTGARDPERDQSEEERHGQGPTAGD